VKICDFGLSRLAANPNEHGNMFSIKWTAPEAFSGNVFNTKCDVWSMGVLMWECWSRGAQPYAAWDELDRRLFLARLKKGDRIAPPESCIEPVKEIMRSCWDLDPAKRPLWLTMIDVLRQNFASPAQGCCLVKVSEFVTAVFLSKTRYW
jgi:serine/threonine protein kinase